MLLLQSNIPGLLLGIILRHYSGMALGLVAKQISCRWEVSTTLFSGSVPEQVVHASCAGFATTILLGTIPFPPEYGIGLAEHILPLLQAGCDADPLARTSFWPCV
jgi:hypothetical protein